MENENSTKASLRKGHSERSLIKREYCKCYLFCTLRAPESQVNSWVGFSPFRQLSFTIPERTFIFRILRIWKTTKATFCTKSYILFTYIWQNFKAIQDFWSEFSFPLHSLLSISFDQVWQRGCVWSRLHLPHLMLFSFIRVSQTLSTEF